MSDEKRALTRHSAPPSEADYEAILDAVMETGRGRWFLHEFAQRNRHSETRSVLSAIQRIEGLLRTQTGETIEDLGHPAAEQIGAAIARAQDMLRGDGRTSAPFDGAVAALEAAQARFRTASMRLQDASHALREEGGHYRICRDLDQQIAELNSARTQLDDATDDIRILVALLGDIESQIGGPQTEGASSATAQGQAEPPAGTAQSGTAPDGNAAAADAELLQIEIEATVTETSVASGIVEADIVDVGIVDVGIVETHTHVTEEAFAPPAPISPGSESNIVPTAVHHASPAMAEDAALSGDLVSGPADFLLEPLPDDELADTHQGGAAVARKSTAKTRDETATKPMRLDSFDPLAPIRALSDEEKIALFS